MRDPSDGAVERQAKRVVGMERGERVCREVPLRERQLELDELALPRRSASRRRAARSRCRVEAADVMSSRVRYGSSGPAAGTTAVPPGGSAAIASAFASATRSTVPRSSRCSGPTCGTTTSVGTRERHTAPRPGRGHASPVSATSTRVSGSSRHTVSGRPISLFRLRSAQMVGTWGAHSAPRMSFVVVFPVDPTTATTCASLFERTSDASAASAASWSSGTSVAAPRARASSTYCTPLLRATKRSPGPTSRESALTAVIIALPGQRPSASAAISSIRSGITTAPVAARARRPDRRTA